MDHEPARPSAANQVYQTVELLEHIFTFLEPTDIVNLKLANKYTRDAIMASKTIRRILWLEPHAPHKALDLQPISNGRCRPVVIEHSENLPTTAKTMGKLNPIFNRLRSNGEIVPQGRVAGVNFAVKPLVYWPHGDWRSMFVTQPPSERIQVHYWRGSECGGHEWVKIRRSSGVRMGDLRDLLGQAMLEQERFVGEEYFEEESGSFYFELPGMVFNPNNRTDVRETLERDNEYGKWREWIHPIYKVEQAALDWDLD